MKYKLLMQQALQIIAYFFFLSIGSKWDEKAGI